VAISQKQFSICNTSCYREVDILHHQAQETWSGTEIFTLLGCYPVKISNYHFGTTYWSHLQKSKKETEKLYRCVTSTLHCNIPKEKRSHLHHSRSLKSHMVLAWVGVLADIITVLILQILEQLKCVLTHTLLLMISACLSSMHLHYFHKEGIMENMLLEVL
jgi:hypothetical protein